jgi:MoaA/NifB/PqqE/SkfB family radical SAM enzyme
MGFRFAGVAGIHLEMTDRCNAACPMCARNINGGRENPQLLGAELSIDDIRRIFPRDVVEQLKFIFLCGNFGDPMLARDTLPTFEYFRSLNPDVSLMMCTNGSGRPSEWWRSLAGVLRGPRDNVTFGIDGIGDTNAIYRRHTSWERIMNSAESFIAAGGRARWDFLVFKHNEHQVEEARELAAKMGFAEFVVKKTARFFRPATGPIDPFPVEDAEGKPLYYLEYPSKDTLQNSENRKIMNENSAPEAFLMESKIDCKSIGEKHIYVAATGKIFPCCFLAGSLQSAFPTPEQAHLARLLRIDGDDSIDGRRRSLSAIVEGPVFAAISDTFDAPAATGRRLPTCAYNCSRNYKPLEAELPTR